MAMVRDGYDVVVMCMVVVAIAIATSSQDAEAAIACNQVQGSMTQCLGYLRNGGAVPGPCCNGVRGLMRMAKTTPDRQTACKCLQSAAASIPGIKPGFASALPGKCGVNIPYKISPSTDCSKVK